MKQKRRFVKEIGLRKRKLRCTGLDLVQREFSCTFFIQLWRFRRYALLWTGLRMDELWIRRVVSHPKTLQLVTSRLPTGFCGVVDLPIQTVQTDMSNL